MIQRYIHWQCFLGVYMLEKGYKKFFFEHVDSLEYDTLQVVGVH
jgi:hypothetical protein